MRRRITITSVAILFMCLTITCGRKGPIEVDKTPPTIVTTNPALGSSDVPPNTVISMTFSKPVDEKTIYFVLMSGGTDTVPCTMTSYSDKTAVFTASNGDLAYSRQYFATVKAGVTDLTGNVMASDYPWSFTTGTVPDKTPPTVLPDTLVPARDAADIPIYMTISVTFSEPMNPSTINTTTFKISSNGSGVNGTVTLDDTGMKAIFMLSGPLVYNTTYTVSIVGGTSGVKDLAGNSLVADYTWSFKTAPQPVPSYTITATSGANGSISPLGVVSVNQGAVQLFTMTPNSGYHVANIQVDGVSVGAVTSYSFSNVTANHTISASFAINTYTVAPLAGANGTISPNTAQTVNYNGTISFIITPKAGYSAVMGGTCGGTLNGDIYMTNPVTANCTVTASFSLNAYTITASAGPNGSISPSGSVIVNYSASQKFMIAPDLGYHVVAVVVDGVSVGAVTSYSFSNVTANHTISASFAINTYTVKPSAGANGTISPNTVQTVNYNGTTSFIITPKAGYSAVMGGTCGGTLNVDTYTTNPVTANCTVTASFSINTYTITASAGPNGSISPSGSVIVNYGTDKTFNITPNATHAIADVLVDNVSQGPIKSYTFKDVTANHTIVATFL